MIGWRLWLVLNARVGSARQMFRAYTRLHMELKLTVAELLLHQGVRSFPL